MKKVQIKSNVGDIIKFNFDRKHGYFSELLDSDGPYIGIVVGIELINGSVKLFVRFKETEDNPNIKNCTVVIFQSDIIEILSPIIYLRDKLCDYCEYSSNCRVSPSICSIILENNIKINDSILFIGERINSRLFGDRYIHGIFSEYFWILTRTSRDVSQYGFLLNSRYLIRDSVEQVNYLHCKDNYTNKLEDLQKLMYPFIYIGRSEDPSSALTTEEEFDNYVYMTSSKLKLIEKQSKEVHFDRIMLCEYCLYDTCSNCKFIKKIKEE